MATAACRAAAWRTRRRHRKSGEETASTGRFDSAPPTRSARRLLRPVSGLAKSRFTFPRGRQDSQALSAVVMHVRGAHVSKSACIAMTRYVRLPLRGQHRQDRRGAPPASNRCFPFNCARRNACASTRLAASVGGGPRPVKEAASPRPRRVGAGPCVGSVWYREKRPSRRLPVWVAWLRFATSRSPRHRFDNMPASCDALAVERSAAPPITGDAAARARRSRR